MTLPINTLPIELYLEKARIAKKSGQKSVNIGIDEATLLADSLAQVMTRLAGDLDQIVQAVQQQEDIVIKMDGGSL
jgi:phage shock protein A